MRTESAAFRNSHQAATKTYNQDFYNLPIDKQGHLTYYVFIKRAEKETDMTKEESQELVYAEATVDRISRYSTAYSLKHNQFVKLLDVREHADGTFSIRASVAFQSGSEVFKLEELTRFTF